jgi:hypothetical protein
MALRPSTDAAMTRSWAPSSSSKGAVSWSLPKPYLVRKRSTRRGSGRMDHDGPEPHAPPAPRAVQAVGAEDAEKKVRQGRPA